jgi:hypothetical protein
LEWVPTGQPDPTSEVDTPEQIEHVRRLVADLMKQNQNPTQPDDEEDAQ